MALSDETVDSNKNEKALALTMLAAVDSQLRTFQECEFAKAVCKKLN